MNSGFVKTMSDIEEARKAGNAWMLFQGDSGGYTWVTIPVALVKATIKSMHLLMHDLETLDVGGTVFKRFPGEVWVAGYDAWIIWMIGHVGEEYQRGLLTDGVWVSPSFFNNMAKGNEIEAEITQILEGKRERLSVALSSLEKESAN